MKPSREFVFGYGSLVASHERGVVARLVGWRRVWGVAMDNSLDLPGYKSYRLRSDGSRPRVHVAFLDVAPSPGEAVTGVCVPVTAAELVELDRRERNYDRVQVSDAIAGGAPGRVWAYVGSHAGRARLRRGLADGTAVVSREYLDGVLAGVGAFAPAELDALERSPAQAGLPVLDLERVEIAPR